MIIWALLLETEKRKEVIIEQAHPRFFENLNQNTASWSVLQKILVI